MSTNEGKPDAGRNDDMGEIVRDDDHAVRRTNQIRRTNEHVVRNPDGRYSVRDTGRDWGQWQLKISQGRKTERLSARLTRDQVDVIRYAAEIEGTDLTNFAVTTLLARALDILADRKVFILDDAAWNEFQALLDAPVSHRPRLEKLFSEPSIFDTRPNP